MRDPRPYRDLARQCRWLLKAAKNPELVQQLQKWAVECDSSADIALRAAGHPQHDLLEQARRHRMRAEEYWVVAEQMQNPTARASFQHLAQTYEALAGQLEGSANGLSRRNKNAG